MGSLAITKTAQHDQAYSERVVLSALCQNSLTQDRRAEVVRLLKRHRFADPANLIIFQALASLPTVETARIRELLPARVNNLGLPDVDLQIFFSPQELDEDRIVRYMETLVP